MKKDAQRTKNRDVRMSTRRPRTSRKTGWTREGSRSRARVRYTCTSLRRLCGVVSHASKFFDSRRREEVTFSGCGPLARSLSLCVSCNARCIATERREQNDLRNLSGSYCGAPCQTSTSEHRVHCSRMCFVRCPGEKAVVAPQVWLRVWLRSGRKTGGRGL